MTRGRISWFQKFVRSICNWIYVRYLYDSINIEFTGKNVFCIKNNIIINMFAFSDLISVNIFLIKIIIN